MTVNWESDEACCVGCLHGAELCVYHITFSNNHKQKYKYKTQSEQIYNGEVGFSELYIKML